VVKRDGTQARLLAAASELFAERGFRGTTIRDIAERARVNVAAGHYHFGSKKALYLEVLRAQFAHVRAELRRGGGARSAAELARLGRAQVVAVLRARSRVMLDVMIGPPPSLHSTLMLREMCDPSEALPVIVHEFIQPMLRETAAVVARLAPSLDPGTIERCVFSVMGQALFYRFTQPAVLLLWDVPAYPTGLARRLAEHITDFSLAGLERVAVTRMRRRRAR
jgi:TetR/AcrR family transcriptional regulator, regulator of cefoperazone and chloramphenicol sensitivity